MPVWCYIMSDKSRRLYTGFTDDLVARVIEHKEKLFPHSFTARYVFDILVFYETYSRPISAKMRGEGNQRVASREETEIDSGEQPGLGRLKCGMAAKSWVESYP